ADDELQPHAPGRHHQGVDRNHLRSRGALAPSERKDHANMATNSVGTITQVIGAVVDVHFEGELPSILSAPHVDNGGRTPTLAVAQHLGENTVRTVAMDTTDGLVRGAEVVDTGSPIMMPVGPEPL